MAKNSDKVQKGAPFFPNAALNNELIDHLLKRFPKDSLREYGTPRESYLPVFIIGDKSLDKWAASTEYTAGDIVVSGSPPDWEASTAYLEDDLVVSGDTVYKAEADGTSGGTAPTGTGTGISDGGMTWASSSNVQAQIYVAEVTGTSGSTAPTGTGTGISDGGITWASTSVHEGLGRAAGSVVGFTDPVILAEDNREALESAVFKLAKPETGRWAVAQQGIYPGERSECTLVGIAWAEMDVTDANHEWAEVNGTGELVSQTSGYAKILYKPEETGKKWCCLQLGYGGGSGTVNCETLRTAYSMPSPTLQDPPLRYFGITGSDGICDYSEIVLCGDDVLHPCVGCTTGSPAFKKLRMSGVTLETPNPPPTNGFDIDLGQDVVLTRGGRCTWLGNINYHLRTDGPTDPQSTIPVRVEYIVDDTEWKVRLILGVDELVYGPRANAHDCMASYVFNYNGPASTLTIDGYDFSSSTIIIDGVEA